MGMRERAVVCSEESNGIRVKVSLEITNISLHTHLYTVDIYFSVYFCLLDGNDITR